MKGKLLCIFALFLIAFTSCDGIKISDNGDLDGMWHLVKLDSIHNAEDVDFSKHTIFWSIQADLLYIDDKSLQHEPCLLRFDKSKGKLDVFDPYIYNNMDEADEKITDVAFLQPYGINALEESFIIEKLNRKSLVLKSNSLVLTFTRY